MKGKSTDWEKILTNQIFNKGLVSRMYKELSKHSPTIKISSEKQAS